METDINHVITLMNVIINWEISAGKRDRGMRGFFLTWWCAQRAQGSPEKSALRAGFRFLKANDCPVGSAPSSPSSHLGSLWLFQKWERRKETRPGITLYCGIIYQTLHLPLIITSSALKWREMRSFLKSTTFSVLLFTFVYVDFWEHNFKLPETLQESK